MSLLLRKVKNNRWHLATSQPDQPLPADPLADLITGNNTLSLWEIADDRSNLPHVVTGLAAAGDHVSNIDVVIIDTQRLSGSISLTKMTQGRTPYVPAAPYHRDMVDLTANDIVRMAGYIRNHVDFFEQFSLKQVETFLAEAIQDGRLNIDHLKPDIAAHLRRKHLV